jgi:hypothetical protein
VKIRIENGKSPPIPYGGVYLLRFVSENDDDFSGTRSQEAVQRPLYHSPTAKRQEQFVLPHTLRFSCGQQYGRDEGCFGFAHYDSGSKCYSWFDLSFK